MDGQAIALARSGEEAADLATAKATERGADGCSNQVVEVFVQTILHH